MKIETVRKYTEKVKKYAKHLGGNYTKVSDAISDGSPKRLTNKRILKQTGQVTIVEDQPVYSKDKSRFFKVAVEEERRRLFFK